MVTKTPTSAALVVLLLALAVALPGAVPTRVSIRQASEPAAASRRPASATVDDLDAIIRQLWSERKDRHRAHFAGRIRSGDVYGLCDIQEALNNLQKYAGDVKDLGILDDLAGTYLAAVPALRKDKDGYSKWSFTAAESYVAKENPSLVGHEVRLCSAQFLYAVTSLLDALVSMPKARRSASMEEFCGTFPSVVVRDHYLRWVPGDTIRWRRLLESAPADIKKDGSGAAHDAELWVLAGASHLMSANKADPNLVPLTAEEKKSLSSLVDVGTALLKSRLTRSQLKDFKGVAVEGLNFDLGMWDAHPEYAYAGYTGNQYPRPEDKKPGAGVGWDISHARRFVDVFDTLYDTRVATGQTFPDDAVMRGLANQVAYGVFNRDFEHPLFTNLMDGSNGWYRVGYANRKDFGYGPYGLTKSIPNGGYGFWSRFNPDIRTILTAFWRWAQRAEGNSDPAFVKHYGTGYFPAAGSRDLLMFLPTIAR